MKKLKGSGTVKFFPGAVLALDVMLGRSIQHKTMFLMAFEELKNDPAYKLDRYLAYAKRGKW